MLDNERKDNFGIRNFNSWKAINATTRISIIWWLIGLLSWHGPRTFQPRIFNPKLQPRNFNPRKQTTTGLKSYFVVQDFMVEKSGTDRSSRVEACGWIFLQLQKKNHGWRVPRWKFGVGIQKDENSENEVWGWKVRGWNVLPPLTWPSKHLSVWLIILLQTLE